MAFISFWVEQADIMAVLTASMVRCFFIRFLWFFFILRRADARFMHSLCVFVKLFVQ